MTIMCTEYLDPVMQPAIDRAVDPCLQMRLPSYSSKQQMPASQGLAYARKAAQAMDAARWAHALQSSTCGGSPVAKTPVSCMSVTATSTAMQTRPGQSSIPLHGCG